MVLLLSAVALAAWLTTRYNYQSDWTANARHTLSGATTELLATLAGPVGITSFSREDGVNALRKRTRELVERYRQYKPDIALTFIDPDLEPERVREMGVSLEGEMVIEYAGKRENLRAIGEQALTNALQRLARAGERRILFLQGHGERNPQGVANHDLKEWAKQLKTKGLRSETLSLGSTPAIPDDTAVLVIASPRAALLPGEVAIIQDYIEQGGNLLWLSDPGESLFGLEALTEQLGISFQPGTIVDATGQMLGIEHPAFIVVPDYPDHPVSKGLSTLTLFPRAQGISVLETGTWQHTPLLTSLERAWSETGPLEGSIRFDEDDDLPGPLSIGVLLTRERPGAQQPDADHAESEAGHDEHHVEHRISEPDGPQQRIAVIGDGDFLANAYLGNGANLELGTRLVNWLSHDDSFIAIAPRTSPDTHLEMTPLLSTVIGFGFLFVLPIALLLGGLVIWLKRRKR